MQLDAFETNGNNPLSSSQTRRVSSKSMCWAAVDHAIRLATKPRAGSAGEPARETRDTINHQEVFTGFWDRTRRAFIQNLGATTVTPRYS